MDFIDSRKNRISAWVKNDLRYRNFSVCYALYAAGIHFTKTDLNSAPDDDLC